MYEREARVWIGAPGYLYATVQISILRTQFEHFQPRAKRETAKVHIRGVSRTKQNNLPKPKKRCLDDTVSPCSVLLSCLVYASYTASHSYVHNLIDSPPLYILSLPPSLYYPYLDYSVRRILLLSTISVLVIVPYRPDAQRSAPSPPSVASEEVLAADRRR